MWGGCSGVSGVWWLVVRQEMLLHGLWPGEQGHRAGNPVADLSKGSPGQDSSGQRCCGKTALLGLAGWGWGMGSASGGLGSRELGPLVANPNTLIIAHSYVFFFRNMYSYPL